MQQPVGFVAEGIEGHVCLLKRSLYGLKQAPRQWYLKFDAFTTSNDVIRSNQDNCVYFKHAENKPFMYLLLYVDDMLLACKEKFEFNF